MISQRIFAALSMAGTLVLVLTSCTRSSGDIRNLAGAGAQNVPVQQPTALPPPLPTDTPPAIQLAIVEATQPAQVIEITRIVEMPVIVTVTPDVIGYPTETFHDLTRAIDESTQPCPARFWKHGRCTATQTQIDQAAQEVQP
jgi:hypothetical protein